MIAKKVLPFWEEKSLTELSRQEWESLCDGCAKCCRIQLEDDEGHRATTNVVCQYLDQQQCACTVYDTRTKKVPTCWQLSPENLGQIEWMPESCAYRLIYEGKSLPEWHPLLVGDTNEMHRLGASVRGLVVSETQVDEDDLEEYIIKWHHSS